MPSILLAEDSATQAAHIRMLLESHGHDVRMAADGQQALDAIQEDQPDLIVTDLMMPVMNGRELTRTVTEQYPAIPVIVITSRGSELLAVDALAEGATNFVPKDLLDARLPGVINEIHAISLADQEFADLQGCLIVPELIFELSSDPRELTPILCYVQRTLASSSNINAHVRIQFVTAIRSALINAICYGNLDLRDDEQLIQSIVRGESEAPDSDQNVQLVISVGVDDARVSVTHEGPGMIIRTSPAPGTPESFELEDCRGMLLMTSFMDEVMLNQVRNQVVMVKRW
ncbi:MAG: response regulator [Pirellulaceae bacterium]|nr:response regulator [Pirellulaceae bacterium]